MNHAASPSPAQALVFTAARPTVRRQVHLGDPESVWQAAPGLLMQAQAPALFARALALLPPGPTLNRLRLETCLAMALFTANDVPACLAACGRAAQLAAHLPLSPDPGAPLPALDCEAGLPLLRQTLSGLAQHGLRAFATAGTLLGLVREGRLLAGDKDIDLAIAFDQWPDACAALGHWGWQPAWTTVRAVNFRSFVHTRSPITLDLYGYEYDYRLDRLWGGWWPQGLPREQGRILLLRPFELEHTDAPWGPHWAVSAPEALLEQFYGPTWRVPDPHFDTNLESPALRAYTDYTRAWGLLRALEAWLQGRRSALCRRLNTLARLHAADPLLPLLGSAAAWAPSTQPRSSTPTAPTPS